ncbi:S9 family peptidase [Kinneretia asaccharophila]|uniref:Dipeptidyl aminopeptidase/acylaminoacyl peptidase n=1 Tax=Roseateles asaccharophilus TaxID=582607 RepID=A0A4R6N765_9BURK|nr:S9 family peptidase [Roseateles asaccharophilus]MDN3544156.1 S9 family peptidase [Roseateles asaccharophilus]TDP09249.1 dipeptidyl aminopeptidase/acylaminoacyl peptidase [Roseateles asaccharophilus]
MKNRSTHRAIGPVRALLCAAGLWLAAMPACATEAPPLPLEIIASLPRLSGVMLSPDGQQIAALLNEADRTVLITGPLQGSQMRTVLSSDNQKFMLNWARWVNNERLLVSVRFASRRDFVGTQETRLLSVKADGSGLQHLVQRDRFTGSARGIETAQQIQDRVIDWLPEDGKHVLLQLASGPDSLLPAVYRLNIETGERNMVQAPERRVYEWMTDRQHRVRLGIREHEGHYEVIERALEGGNWRTLWAFDGFKRDAVWPLGFGSDPQELYVRANHEGRDAIFTVRLDQPELPRSLKLAHPRYDIRGRLLRSPASGEVIGLQGSQDEESGEASRSEFWDPQWRTQVQAIDLALPQRENRLIAISRDEQRYLVYSSGNGQPGEYFAGDRRTGKLALIGKDHPALRPEALVGKRHATIQARDGLALNAYLSLPRGHQPGRDGPLPLVLLPHGGPHSRDDLDFDAWTEFLASRRYAVLQVNFRGSDGYGHDFAAAGLQRWGLEMQDDLSDAVAWAIGQGIVDAKRVCIVGGSYGGYAALMGAVKTPDLYRCAVSFAGVSDLQDLIAHEAQYIGGRAMAERQIGRAWGDRERLRATSPALQAERIRVPVLLVHGTADRVVPVEQSRDMAKALKRAGKPYEYIELEDGDHYLGRNSHRLQFFQALERFLARALQPQQTAPTTTQ